MRRGKGPELQSWTTYRNVSIGDRGKLRAGPHRRPRWRCWRELLRKRRVAAAPVRKRVYIKVRSERVKLELLDGGGYELDDVLPHVLVPQVDQATTEQFLGVVEREVRAGTDALGLDPHDEVCAGIARGWVVGSTWSSGTARKGTILNRQAVEAQQKDSALLLTADHPEAAGEGLVERNRTERHCLS
eukprot:SAG22_NODE_13_length_33548_cov_57.167773_16_plen_187_part_00